MLTPVKFLVSATVDNPPRSYATGEVAGFSPEIAQRLITAGIATKVPRSLHPLVQQAMEVPDEAVRRAGEFLRELPNRLDALDQQAASLRGQLADVERAEARSLIHGHPVSQNGVRAALEEVERQSRLLVAEEERLWADLLNALMAHVERAIPALFDNMAPTYRSIADDVGKVHAKHARLDGIWARIEALRTLAAALPPVAAQALDASEGRLAAQIAGDATTGVSGVARLPRALGPLLAAIATHQARQGGSR